MTREEAINIMKVIVHMLEEKYDTDRVEEAVDMAIEALEQEPCEDCISRQAAIDVLTKTSGIRGDALKALYDLPSVTPVEKMGRWEWVQYDSNPNIGNWHCSECRCVVVECVDKNEKGGIPLYKYCPQCGAKMQEELNDDEKA